MIKYSLIGRVGKKKSVPSKKQNKTWQHSLDLQSCTEQTGRLVKQCPLERHDKSENVCL